MEKLTNCKHCGAVIAKGTKRCPQCGGKNKKPLYKRGWVWILILILIGTLINRVNDSLSRGKEYNKTYVWPESALVSLLPKPASDNGRISSESEDYFSMDVYKTDQEAYDQYTSACKENGFTVDYRGSSDYYHAENEQGYSLALSYDGKEEIMGIQLSVPKEEAVSGEASGAEDGTEGQTKEATAVAESETVPEGAETTDDGEASETPTEETAANAEEADGMDPEFKAAMDSYEAFFDEYVEFMKKFENDSSNPALLIDYASYMAKYADFMGKLDAINEDDLNDAELAYYIEVNARITQKLLEVSEG